MGWMACIAFICLACLIVRGTRITRMATVNRMIATPKLENEMSYRTTRLLIIGRMITSFHMVKKKSNSIVA